MGGMGGMGAPGGAPPGAPPESPIPMSANVWDVLKAILSGKPIEQEEELQKQQGQEQPGMPPGQPGMPPAGQPGMPPAPHLMS